MQEWHSFGYFTPELMVKKINEDEFQPLKDRKDLNFKFPTESDKILPNAPVQDSSSTSTPALNQQDADYYNLTSAYSSNHYPNFSAATATEEEAPLPKVPFAAKYEDYVISGSFNVVTGKFQRQDSSSYFQSKNLPEDRAGRQLAHYFDVSALENVKPKKAKPHPSKSKKKKKQKKDTETKGVQSPGSDN